MYIVLTIFLETVVLLSVDEEEVTFCLTMEEWCGGAFKWCERSSDKHTMFGCVGMESVSLFFL